MPATALSPRVCGYMASPPPEPLPNAPIARPLDCRQQRHSSDKSQSVISLHHASLQRICAYARRQAVDQSIFHVFFEDREVEGWRQLGEPLEIAHEQNMSIH